MTLIIKQLEVDDYGIYMCNARNSLGMADDQIRTYKIDMQTQRPIHSTGTSWDLPRGNGQEVSTGIANSGSDFTKVKNSQILRTYGK